MQTNALGPLLRLEITADGVRNHRVQFGKRIALRGDAAAARRIPARNVTAGFGARLDLENDFTHGKKLRANCIKVNELTGGVFGLCRIMERTKFAADGVRFHLLVSQSSSANGRSSASDSHRSCSEGPWMADQISATVLMPEN